MIIINFLLRQLYQESLMLEQPLPSTRGSMAARQGNSRSATLLVLVTVTPAARLVQQLTSPAYREALKN